MRVLVVLFVLALLTGVVIDGASRRNRYRKPVIRYPKDTEFWASDFFVSGCKNFIYNCPKDYKSQIICGRNYDGDYKTFDNYCFMQYENCNSWRKFNPSKCILLKCSTSFNTAGHRLTLISASILSYDWRVFKREKC